jgi:phospholipase C
MNFVLQDRMFEPVASWSLPMHLYMVSEWSAKSNNSDPMSSINEIVLPAQPTNQTQALYSWTDLPYLMYKKNVSWAYYLDEGYEPDTEDDSMIVPPVPQKATVQEFGTLFLGLKQYDRTISSKTYSRLVISLAQQKITVYLFCCLDNT